MQVVVLAGFVVCLTVLAPEVLDDLLAPGVATPAAVGVYLLVAFLVARVNTELAFRSIRRQRATRQAVMKRHGRIVLLTNLWLIFGLAGVVVMGYGRWVMGTLRLARVPLVGKLLALAPFVAGLLLTWTANYPFFRLVRSQLAAPDEGGEPRATNWSLRQYLAYNTRHHLLFILVPVGLIVLARDVVELYVEPVLPPGEAYAYLAYALMVAAGVGVFYIAPLLIVRIWRTAPLPDGPLRRGLEALCRRLQLRCRDILVWRSDGVIANAGVMGLTRHVRYVLLSDGLLDRMSDREVETIFAHEAGHIVSHHILYAVVFAVTTGVLCSIAGSLAAEATGTGNWGAIVVTLSLIAVAWGFGFGWVSRRFEGQSDVMAAWLMGRSPPPGGAPDGAPAAGEDADVITPEGAALFAHSLERIAQLNGIPARQPNWRHGSIAARVSYILWLGSTGGSRRHIDRLVDRVKLLLLALLTAAIVAAVL